MLRSIIAGFLVAISAVASLRASDEDANAGFGSNESIARQAEPRSTGAVEARRKYDGRVKQAREAYAKALADAERHYIAELSPALKAAMSAGPSGLDEAKRIDAAKVEANDRLKQDDQGHSQDAQTIISATYGAKGSAIDVTNSVKRRLSLNQDLWVDHNITDGRPATTGDLTIIITDAGKRLLFICHEGSRVFISEDSNIGKE